MAFQRHAMNKALNLRVLFRESAGDPGEALFSTRWSGRYRRCAGWSAVMQQALIADGPVHDPSAGNLTDSGAHRITDDRER